MAPRKVGYIQFREEVRRYNPSDLIPFLAAQAARRQGLTTSWDDNWPTGFLLGSLPPLHGIPWYTETNIGRKT